MRRSAKSFSLNRLVRWIIRASYHDREFLKLADGIEGIISRALSLATIMVIIVATVDLILLLSGQLFRSPLGFFNSSLQEIFGSLLSILIALEILENITAYLRKHVVQVELVVATSLTAVARKIIILDLSKIDGLELIGLGLAIVALSASYWLIRQANQQPPSINPYHAGDHDPDEFLDEPTDRLPITNRPAPAAMVVDQMVADPVTPDLGPDARTDRPADPSSPPPPQA
ncbi:MAG: phosphate-starvation-inducible PsiE family protein [Limnothrix sp.]|nr:phosphate-starvation-inducible PsiE family protein [Limnothrix sp.]